MNRAPTHGCIVKYTTHPAEIFLALHNPDYSVKAVFPLRNGYKVLCANASNSFIIRQLDEFTGFKRLINVSRPNESTIYTDYIDIDDDYLKEIEDMTPDDGERRCCGVCGELCSRQDMSDHYCIIKHNADPAFRFLILPEYNLFHPITNNGEEIVVGVNDFTGYYIMSLDHYEKNEKEFYQIELPNAPTQIPPAITKSASTTIKSVPSKQKKNNSTKVHFSVAEDIKWIRKIELSPEIWNCTLPMETRGENIIQDIWAKIEENFPSKSVQDLQNRWRNIKTAREKRVAENKEKTPSGSARENLRNYVYEENMAFLKTIDLASKKTSSNISYIPRLPVTNNSDDLDNSNNSSNRQFVENAKDILANDRDTNSDTLNNSCIHFIKEYYCKRMLSLSIVLLI